MAHIPSTEPTTHRPHVAPDEMPDGAADPTPVAVIGEQPTGAPHPGSPYGGAEVVDPLLLGRLVAFDGYGVVVLQQRLPVRPRAAWTALTDQRELARWLGDVDGDLHLGGTARWRFRASGAEGRGRVEVCEPPTRLRLALSEDEHAGARVIDVTLVEVADGTRLRAAQTGLPLDRLAAYGAGLQVHAEDLAAHLVGQAPTDADARMEALLPRYARLPVEPS